ncbi:MAG: hypothetical protein ABFC96_17750 [Thermoguttaceae bacterium]
MTVFIESPWPWLLIGIIAETVLAILLSQTRRGVFLWAMLGVAAFVGAGLIVERLVVTDREGVEQTLDAAVAAAEANDINRLLPCISPSAESVRNQARMLLARVDVKSVWVRHLEIKIKRLTSPKTAEARFVATGQGNDRKGEAAYATYSAPVTMKFRLEGGRWLVIGYSVEGIDPSRL